MIKAEVIADSISEHNIRLTTFLLRYPKFIHGEFMTHRVFSRNASSSRAVPVHKNIEEVNSLLRACPVSWGSEQKGMQPGDELEGDDRYKVMELWDAAAGAAVQVARAMVSLGAHKSIINRILEPYLHINVLVTATEYMNFFGLRLDKMADPTMRALAHEMWLALDRSEPVKLKYDEWHTPFSHMEDGIDVYDSIKVSVARCARLSYHSFETGLLSSVKDDLALYDRLYQSKHFSPFEHQARPDYLGYTDNGEEWMYPYQHGNFHGWRQYRKTISGENQCPLPEPYIPF